MKKQVVSLAATLLIASSSNAADNMDAIEVISVATKTKKSITGVAASVEVITQKQIEKIGAASLKDIFLRTPGLTMQYGTFPSASSKSKSSISIRGMSANGTLILLDGRRLAGEVKNPYDLERIPASIIQRIEIVKGPMSSLYGADAVGGVINIITKQPSKDMKIDANVRYGQNDSANAQSLNLSLSIQGKNDKFGYSTYASLIQTDPYEQAEIADVWSKNPAGPGNPNIKPSINPALATLNVQDTYPVDTTYREDSTIYTLGTRLTYDFTSDFILGTDINYFDEERDGVYIGYTHPALTPGGALPIFNAPVNSHDENKRLDLSIDATFTPNDDLSIKARAYNSDYKKRNDTTAIYYEDFGYPNEKASSNAAMNADVDLSVYELSASYFLSQAHLLTGGLEYREEERTSSLWTNFASKTTKTVEYKSIYLQDDWEVNNKLNIIFGGRYEDIDNADTDPTFRVGAIYSFNKLANLRVNFAQGFRTPDMREMYIYADTPNGPQRGADVLGYDLKPEETNAYEIGLGGQNNIFGYDLVFFYNEITNRIEQLVNQAGITTFENISDANTYGMELSLNYQITKNLKADFFWTELSTENEDTNDDLEFNPKRSLMLSFNFQATKSLDLSVTGKYVGEQYYSEVLNRSAPTQQIIPNTKTDDFTIIDLNIDYKVDKIFTIYGGINNITDERVDDILGSNVGTYYFAGARMHF